ncbi:MAG: magnesium transporter [Gammaproteobacteria bacterium]|nr:magnesium transporter [Gammaproteobacteria bacterium]MDX2459274.1 magnesium transporter [Gammaproteobacteria bacterium]
MTQHADKDPRQDNLRRLNDALEREAISEVYALVRELHPADIALLLESVPEGERDIVWSQLDPASVGEVLAEADDAIRASHMRQMAPQALAAVAQEVDPDDAADILQDLPEPVADEVLQAMDEQHRARLESVLAYPEDTAGGLMNVDVLTVRADVTLETVLRYLRRRGEIPERTNRLFVVGRDSEYLGMLRLADLLIRDPEDSVDAHIIRERDAIPATMASREVAHLFEQRNLISAPVIDDAGVLIGRITIDDVVDVIRDEGEQALMRMAGLDEEDDIFASVFATSRRRMLWLGVNLATALLASWVIGLFADTIEKVVALAILMPVVASMGGIAGSQTLTIVIRGMALGQVGQSNAGWLLNREVMVGFINSVLWAFVVAIVATYWFGQPALGVIVAVALVINLVIAAIAGTVLPLIMRRLLIDPALAGGVVLTTITDVVGFMTFLGLGAIFLAN